MIITSEQVGKGHPDKICDQVSDMFVTEILKKDRDARVAIETSIKGFKPGLGKLMVFGEIKTSFDLDKEEMISKIKDLLLSIDKDYEGYDIDWQIGEQSVEINAKVDGEELGAGDQGLMFGYATNETKSRLPIPYALASFIIKKYEEEMLDGENYKADSKAQVSYDYDNHKLINVNLSVQHSIPLEQVVETLNGKVKEWVEEFNKENNLNLSIEEITINPGGDFKIGGAQGDAGTTGRKIIADTYGGLGRHGGGAFSGKDYSKVDRSGAYYARKIAKSIVDAGMADLCEVQVAYLIGEKKPVTIFVETFETEKVSKDKINSFVMDNYNWTLQEIVDNLNLKDIDYTKTTLHGHFGKDLPWEN